jgi:hypothetical protein
MMMPKSLIITASNSNSINIQRIRLAMSDILHRAAREDFGD